MAIKAATTSDDRGLLIIGGFLESLPKHHPIKRLSKPELGVCVTYVGKLVTMVPPDGDGRDLRAAMEELEAGLNDSDRRLLKSSMRKIGSLDLLYCVAIAATDPDRVKHLKRVS